MRILPRRLHAFMDYPFYLAMAMLPIVLGLGNSHPMAFVLPLTLGVAGLVMTALTDHETGLVAVIPFHVHHWLEAVAGLVLMSAAFVYGFVGVDLVAAISMGFVLLGCATLNRPAPSLVPAE